ncbi:MAG: hypothetical protein ACWGQW_01725 [bacterium]
MRLVRGKVNWWEAYANEPGLQILVDKMPDLGDLRYEERNGLYYAEKDGYVSFYYYVRPGEGFGGRAFKVVMKDGEEKILKGPWSSNSGSMNEAGFGPCVNVSIIDEPASYERGYTFYAGSVTLDLIEQNKHLIDIGSGYHRKCGTGCTKEQEEYIEFPEGSSLVMKKNERFGWYVPCVLLPDGTVWSKNNLESDKKSNSADLSQEQAHIL